MCNQHGSPEKSNIIQKGIHDFGQSGSQWVRLGRLQQFPMRQLLIKSLLKPVLRKYS